MGKKKNDVCQVPECSTKEYAAGVCKKHHQENYVLGCSEKLKDGSECPYPILAKGKCSAHYFRNRRRKSGDAAPPQDKPVRGYSQERVTVFTRIPKEYAEVILRHAGRPKGMYEEAQKALIAYAKRLQRAETAAG